MSNPEPHHQPNDLASQLYQISMLNKSLNKALEAEISQATIMRIEVQRDLEHLRTTILTLEKIVRGGNGQASLTLRTSKLEDRFEMLTTNLEKIQEHLEDAETEKKNQKSIYYPLLITSIISLVSAIIAALMTAWLT